MGDFAKVITSTLLGAVIALFGTYYTINSTAHKEHRAELRQKLESLVAGVVRSNKCFDIWVIERVEPKDCVEQEPLWRSITLTELYFPELRTELIEFQKELLDGKAELMACEIGAKSLTKKQLEARDACAMKVYEKYNPSGKLETLFNKTKIVLPRLQE
jgi:hypothetical protein